MTGPQQRFDVLVIGGGPAGVAAAARAAQCGVKVGIVDDNERLGGQIWRSESEVSRAAEAAEWTGRLASAGAAILCGMTVFHQPRPGLLLAESSEGVHELQYAKLVLATGARERFLPFPGWTLPNVMGAGGLQAMVKSGLPVRGKRIVVAGTGPLLLAVAAYLRKLGAQIPIICEQASWSNLARFGCALLGHPGKISQGFRLKKELAGVPFAANCWPVAAKGGHALEAVTISRNGRIETIPCDFFGCGFHLVPNLELPLLLGCQTENGNVSVDDLQSTSVASVFCAGEPTGIGGVELALVEGQIAGLVAAGRATEAREMFGERGRLRGFARSLDRAFQLRPELKSVPSPATMVCRCEDVPYSRLRKHKSWREAKLHTRCGMGPCQGRVCGPATEFLFNWDAGSVRPPIFPARVKSLATWTGQAKPEMDEVSGGR
jgi:D-hydroxyproline dehydrogenase subunit alpha